VTAEGRSLRVAGARTRPLAAGDAAIAAQRLDEALQEWRGPALADVDLVPFARAEAGRLEEERLAALEARAEALLACGRHRELIAELESLTVAHPLRERFWFQRMLALYRVGRQADARRAYRDLRAILVAELAIEPGPDLRDLEARILRQDRALDGPAWDGPAPDTPTAGPARPAGKHVVPQTRYALTEDGIHVAYQVIGEGDQDIVFVPGLMSHLDLIWEDHETADFYRRLAKLGRLILFDKRDTGLSDRAPGDMSIEERMEDVRAVMRAAGLSQAVLFGYFRHFLHRARQPPPKRRGRAMAPVRRELRPGADALGRPRRRRRAGPGRPGSRSCRSRCRRQPGAAPGWPGPPSGPGPDPVPCRAG